MGVGAADTEGRLAASVGELEAVAPDFSPALDVPNGGVLRTLRAKIQLLAQDDRPVQWSAALCERWMAAAPEQASVLYIDGHVRVYNGSQTQLPRHHVARQRPCVRATTDYWVSAMDGQPFFVINQVVDPGLIQVIEEQIVPQLDERVTAQPGAEQLAADARRHRFTLVFDREGYSPAFLPRMKAQRNASPA